MAISIEKVISNFVETANEDFSVAQGLLSERKIRHELFYVHLAVEKLLKAHVARQIQEVPPRIHNLLRLVNLAKLECSAERMRTLEIINEFNIESRYGDISVRALPAEPEVRMLMKDVEDIVRWLNQTL